MISPNAWFNLLLVLVIASATWGATHYLDNRQAQPRVIVAPGETRAALSEPGETAPGFSFTDMNGKERKITDFKGKIVILNFWATWCAPCIVEFPALLDAAEKYKKDTVLIALSSDLEKEKITQFLSKMKKQRGRDAGKNVYIAIDDMGRITQDMFGTFRLPETIIIDREQDMRAKLVGASWEPEHLNKMIEDLQ